MSTFTIGLPSLTSGGFSTRFVIDVCAINVDFTPLVNIVARVHNKLFRDLDVAPRSAVLV